MTERDLTRWSWPAERWGDAIRTLTAPRRPGRGSNADAADDDEVTRVGVSQTELRTLLRSGPALIETGRDGGSFLATRPRPWGRVLIESVTGEQHVCSADRLARAIVRSRSADESSPARRAFENAGLTPKEAVRAESALGSLLGRTAPLTVRLVRPAPHAPLLRQLDARVFGWFVALALIHLAQTALLVASWWIVGRGLLQGAIDSGWMIGWALALLTIAPLRSAATWVQGRTTVAVSGALRRRLLAGSFAFRDNAGDALGRTLEVDGLEFVATTGVFYTLLAASELMFAVLVMATGAVPLLQTSLLVSTLALLGAGAWRYARARDAWTRERVRLSRDLTDAMIGHRTRLVQQDPRRRHQDEDAALATYAMVSRAMDRALLPLALLPRAWLFLGTAAIIPGVLGASDGAAVAVSVGGALLAYLALQRFSQGGVNLVDARALWRELAPIYRAARPPARPAAAVSQSPAPVRASDQGSALIRARDVRFHYDARPSARIDAPRLEIARGDSLLLTGPSGAGKSTLLSLLAGMREPAGGLLLFRGLDRAVLGHDTWRRRIVLVPQSHENYLFGDTLAFNLLLGAWPAAPGALLAADRLCREIGLGPLLNRMPLGLYEVVGETGWRLSQGERNRVFIARALLQEPDVLLLDESLASLDPETLTLCWQAIRSRVDTIVLASHDVGSSNGAGVEVA